jgi:hypothetical protein
LLLQQRSGRAHPRFSASEELAKDSLVERSWTAQAET